MSVEARPMYVVMSDCGKPMLATEPEVSAIAVDVVYDDADEWIQNAQARIAEQQAEIKRLRQAAFLTEDGYYAIPGRDVVYALQLKTCCHVSGEQVNPTWEIKPMPCPRLPDGRRMYFDPTEAEKAAGGES